MIPLLLSVLLSPGVSPQEVAAAEAFRRAVTPACVPGVNCDLVNGVCVPRASARPQVLIEVSHDEYVRAMRGRLAAINARLDVRAGSQTAAGRCPVPNCPCGCREGQPCRCAVETLPPGVVERREEIRLIPLPPASPPVAPVMPRTSFSWPLASPQTVFGVNPWSTPVSTVRTAPVTSWAAPAGGC